MSASKFCLLCGTAAAPVEHGVKWGSALAHLALGGAASYMLARVQPALWWLPLAGAASTAMASARPHPPTCRTCGSSQLIPIDAPVAVARMRAMEAAADRVLSGDSDDVSALRSEPSEKPN